MLVKSNPFNKESLAPDFSLIDTVSGDILSLDDVKGEKGTVIMFICNHCPYVKHVNAELVKLAKDYQPKGIGFVAISSNDVNYVPEDGPAHMKAHALEVGYPFPYLYDESQEIARAYKAACTPDFYVFNASLRSIYHGQLDNSRPRQDAANGKDIRAVLDALLAGKAYDGPELPSMGCNIKWK